MRRDPYLLHAVLVLAWVIAEARACDARRTERAAVMPRGWLWAILVYLWRFSGGSSAAFALDYQGPRRAPGETAPPLPAEARCECAACGVCDCPGDPALGCTGRRLVEAPEGRE